jgi:hypothetical protein
VVPDEAVRELSINLSTQFDPLTLLVSTAGGVADVVNPGTTTGPMESGVTYLLKTDAEENSMVGLARYDPPIA